MVHGKKIKFPCGKGLDNRQEPTNIYWIVTHIGGRPFACFDEVFRKAACGGTRGKDTKNWECPRQRFYVRACPGPSAGSPVPLGERAQRPALAGVVEGGRRHASALLLTKCVSGHASQKNFAA